MNDFVVPDSIEPRVGWKVLLPMNGRLFSPTTPMEWTPRKRATAECPFHNVLGMDSVAPHKGCTCGIYMVDTPQQCNGYFQGRRLLVKVAMWGRIMPGTLGVRGQFAYPQKIYALPDDVVVAATVAQKFGIPYEVVTEETAEPGVAWTMNLPVPDPAAAEARVLYAKAKMLKAKAACFSFVSLASASLSLGLLLDPPPGITGAMVGLFGSLAFWAGCDWRRERRRWLELSQE